MTGHESEQRRRRLPVWLWLAVGAAALAGAASGTWMLWPSTDRGPGVRVEGQQFVKPPAPPSNPGHPITATGQVVGTLYPGTSTVIRVTVTNTNNQDLTITSIRGTVGSPSAAGCQASWFTITDYSGSTTLPKRGTATVDLPFAMLNDTTHSQDACRTATIPVSFSATATGG